MLPDPFNRLNAFPQSVEERVLMNGVSIPYFIPRRIAYACMHNEGPGPPWKERPVACNLRFTGVPYIPPSPSTNNTNTNTSDTTITSLDRPHGRVVFAALPNQQQTQTFDFKFSVEDVKAERFAFTEFPAGLEKGFTQMNVSAVPDGDNRGRFLVGLDSFEYEVGVAVGAVS